MSESMLEVRDLSKKFVKRLDLAAKLAQRLGADIHEEVVHAVDCVSISIAPGEVVGLVGESGCGKSTIGRMIAGILEPTSGDIIYKGQSLGQMSQDEAEATALQIQMIFQDPFASLNPRMRVQDIIGEAPVMHGVVRRDQVADDVASVSPGRWR